MKRPTSTLAVLSLAITLFANPVHAETDGSRTVATIPFDFVVNGVSLPAGYYEFVGTTGGIVLIRNANGRTVFTRIGVPVQPNAALGKSTVKFISVDGHYVLSQVWNDLADTGTEFRYGRSGTELTKPTVH